MLPWGREDPPFLVVTKPWVREDCETENDKGIPWWLRLGPFTAMGPGLIPDRRTKIPKSMWHGQKKNKLKKKKRKKRSETQLLHHVVRGSDRGGERAGGSENLTPSGPHLSGWDTEPLEKPRKIPGRLRISQAQRKDFFKPHGELQPSAQIRRRWKRRGP